MSLPGLGLSAPAPTTTTAAPPRTIHLNPNTEFRFETSTTQALTIKLLPTPNASTSGDAASTSAPENTAEIFGTPLAPSSTYSFIAAKSAVYTHHGCTLEVSGESESEYVADETNGAVVANVHFALENLRETAAARLARGGSADGGPRVLVVGPTGAGKTSLIKTLTAYAVRECKTPCVVSLNPQEGMLSPPACFSAAVFGTGAVFDVEDAIGGGWGSSPVAGPSAAGVRMPVVYQYGYERIEENMEVMRRVTGRLAVAVTSRFEEDEGVKAAGLLIDLAGADGKEGMEVVDHIVSEFSITTILTLGSERLHSDLTRKYPDPTAPSTNPDQIHIVKLPTSGGAVPRSPAYLSHLQSLQSKQYFFGDAKTSLSPYTQNIDISPQNCPFTTWRLLPTTPTTSSAVGKGDDDDGDMYRPGGYVAPTSGISAADSPLPERMEITPELTQQVLAVKHCARDAGAEAVRDASVMGFLYVIDVDRERSRARVLSPVGGRLPGGACVVGVWPGAVGGVMG